MASQYSVLVDQMSSSATASARQTSARAGNSNQKTSFASMLAEQDDRDMARSDARSDTRASAPAPRPSERYDTDRYESSSDTSDLRETTPAQDQQDRPAPKQPRSDDKVSKSTNPAEASDGPVQEASEGDDSNIRPDSCWICL